MTIIAYRGGYLAADSLVSRAGLRVGRRDKIWRIPGGRVAITGYLAVAIAIAEWLRGGREGQQPNGALDDETGSCIFFPDRGRSVLYESGQCCPLPTAPYHAFGIGAEIALGAFHRGATAQEAVRAAIAHHPNCGGRVRFLGP